MNRRQLLGSLAQGTATVGLLGLAGQGLTSVPARSSLQKDGTMTGHCLESLAHALQLGNQAIAAKLVSKNEVVSAKENLVTMTQEQLGALFQKEYYEQNVVQIKGWTLARSEAQFYAALGSVNTP